jgi:hypothetical protein
MLEYRVIKLIKQNMEDFKKLKKAELLEKVEELQLEVISLRAEVKILRDYYKKNEGSEDK